jgi:hypothetical protein
MSRRFQFSLRALLVVMLAVACFFGGIRFELERRRRADEAIELAAKSALRAQKSIYTSMTVDELSAKRRQQTPKDTARALNNTMPTLKRWHKD